MKSGAVVFFAAFLALSASWAGFVLAPQIQIGREVQTKSLGSGDLYPLAAPGLAQQGAAVFRSEGCVYCHSQQVGQEGARVEIVLTDAGTNAAAVEALIAKLNLKPANVEAAGPAVKEITEAGGKANIEVFALGPDISRGWGSRRSVAHDYLYDHPVLPGTRRVGPDLANVGLRLPDANWQLLHLYAPASVVAGSTMPAYRYLFETRKIGNAPSPDALNLPEGHAPPPGYEVVPTQNAKALAAYLVSLRAEAPLFEAPVTPPPAAVVSTNAPEATAQ
ncbi:MAG TPA: cbb3-type cytochrome c oxidase subunit II [Verrucomicrobiota bacterium]|nr:cbb3-type cytochrome c oxidase subunit II [Verrucomicrobiota bacterium]